MDASLLLTSSRELQPGLRTMRCPALGMVRLLFPTLRAAAGYSCERGGRCTISARASRGRSRMKRGNIKKKKGSKPKRDHQADKLQRQIKKLAEKNKKWPARPSSPSSLLEQDVRVLLELEALAGLGRSSGQSDPASSAASGTDATESRLARSRQRVSDAQQGTSVAQSQPPQEPKEISTSYLAPSETPQCVTSQPETGESFKPGCESNQESKSAELAKEELTKSSPQGGEAARARASSSGPSGARPWYDLVPTSYQLAIPGSFANQRLHRSQLLREYVKGSAADRSALDVQCPDPRLVDPPTFSD